MALAGIILGSIGTAFLLLGIVLGATGSWDSSYNY